ncbi:MAG: S8 family serine peptidase [Arachnia propionica]|uniref:S8 family serine peptidase n=1 Tax=Arachnia propionica TaxID=1750 RepID=UPI002707FF74|nr:S8 family serine peptidase [Arachnia propionica]
MRKALVTTAALSLLLTLVSPSAVAEEPPAPPPFRSETPTAPGTGPGSPDEPQHVIVLLKQEEALDRVLGRWTGVEGFDVRRRFGHLVDGFSATLPKSRLRALAADPDVETVQKVKTYQTSMQTAGDLTQSVAARTDLGVDGAGIVVSVIDTGIDPTHQDMRLDDGVATKLTPQGEHATAKVPYGWNYADQNSNFVDATASMHGMHVAGIVAANGGPDADVTTNGRINGIAPNAQLLAMKVFSNDPAQGGAKEDDIIAAIEDSVTMGADIINMSLGAANGTNESSIGQGRAIAAAQAAGVQVIVAAGNDGLNGSSNGSTVDHSSMLDDGTMGNPASTTEALSIASVDNSHSLATLATVNTANGPVELPYKLQIGRTDEQEHGIVFAGFGRPEDFPAHTTGNFALIERGEVSFTDKFTNAVEAGAIGVIVYNNAAGGENFTGMSGLQDFTIPGAFMFHSVGEQLKQAIANNGGTARITLTGKTRLLELSPTLRASDFSSWGATPELDFKPQLAGIGGNVRSTINDNAYLEESGTSMAAPHVAGAFALALTKYREMYPDLPAGERNQLLRTAFSNTAKILEHSPGQPYAPRQIGAGLIQTVDAVNTRVFATVDGHPTIALRQVDGPRTFTVTLTNRDDRDHTFTTGATCVVTESQQAGEANTTGCHDTEELSPQVRSVTVPAGGTATLDYTLTPDTSERHWIQGWATLDSGEDDQPDLAIPYLGFVGDWNAEPIIDHPRQDGRTPVLDGVLGPDQANLTQLYGPLGHTETSSQWMSPNGDGFFDELFPLYMLLRSAGEIQFEVVKDGAVVRSFGTERDMSRLPLRLVPPAIQSAAEGATNQAWDGTLYDPDTATFEKVPDADLGTYRYRIRSRLSEDFDWQVTELSIGIDTVAPEASFTVVPQPDGSRLYTVTASDDRSGLENPAGVFARDAASATVFEPTITSPGTYTFTIPAAIAGGDSYVEILAMDKAGNTTELRDFYQTRPIRVLNSHKVDRWIGKDSVPFLHPEIIDGKAVIDLVVAPGVARVEWNGAPVEITEGRARVLVPLTPGRTELDFVAHSANGDELGRTDHWLGYDTTPPTLQITSAPLNENGELVPAPDGTVTISGRVSDDLAAPTDVALLENGLEEITLDDEGRFTHVFTPTEQQSFLVLVALDHASTYKQREDYANSAAKAWPIAGRASQEGLHAIFDDPMMRGGRFGQSAYLVNPAFQNLEIVNQDAQPGELAARLTVTGRLSEEPRSFQVGGKDVELDDELRFSIPIDLSNAINRVGYVAVAKNGERIEGSWRMVYDRALPGIDLTVDPRLHADGAIYLREQPSDIQLSGEVWDNEFGYRLEVNGNVVEEFENLWDSGADNRLPFSTTVPGAKGGQTMLLSLKDGMGNGFEQQVPVVLDDTAPKVGIDDQARTLGRDAEFTVTATDEHLESLTVLLDDREVATEVVALVPHPRAGHTEYRQEEVVSSTTGSEGTAETSKQVTLRLKDLPDLTSGRHTISAVARDKAGNSAVASSVVNVDEPPTITGPDTVTVEAGKDPRQAIREAYQATDPEDGALELVFDATTLVPGHATELELSATDSAGNTTRRVVTITLQIRVPGTPEAPGLPGTPGGGGKPQKPMKPVPPVTRPGLPSTGR